MQVFTSPNTFMPLSTMGLLTQNRAPVQVLGSVPRRAFSLPEHIVMEMPNLSPTMEKVIVYININHAITEFLFCSVQGNIRSWNKKVGDTIAPGDVLASIETDKAVVDFEMQEDGYVAKLFFSEGTKDVPLGEAIAIIVENEADIAAFANYDGSSAPAEAAAPA